MRRLGLSCLALLMALTSAQMAVAAKAGKVAKKEKVKGPAPLAKESEIKELKGIYTWGMSLQVVKDKLLAKIDESYKDQLEKARLEPAKNDKIRQNLKKYISHGELIGRKGKDLVSIPIPQIDIPRFRFGEKQSGGTGQGDGEPGDPLSGQEQEGDGTGKAGQDPGERE